MRMTVLPHSPRRPWHFFKPGPCESMGNVIRSRWQRQTAHKFSLEDLIVVTRDIPEDPY